MTIAVVWDLSNAASVEDSYLLRCICWMFMLERQVRGGE
jgi:hypothetical protein